MILKFYSVAVNLLVDTVVVRFVEDNVGSPINRVT
jgi:hypothetical protein